MEHNSSGGIGRNEVKCATASHVAPQSFKGVVYLSMQTTIAEVLIDIEAQLRQLGMWDKIPPSSKALASTEPFCVDTMTLPQWLQFVFLPTIYRMLEEEEALPERCGIAPMAEEFFRGTGLAIGELLSSLERIDELLTAASED